MSNELDGDIKIGVDLETKSVRQSVNKLRKTIAETFGNQNTATLSKNIRKASQEVKSLEKDIENAKIKLDAIKSGDTSGIRANYRESLKSLKLTMACNESAATGKVIAL